MRGGGWTKKGNLLFDQLCGGLGRKVKWKGMSDEGEIDPLSARLTRVARRSCAGGVAT